MNDNSSRVIDVDINDILPNRLQPRIQFDEEEIIELSDSIKKHGVIQPIVVRTIGDKYEIIAGERRYKASVLAGKETVPVIIKNLNDKDSAEIALIENVQRKNLTPIEEALSYKKILDMGYTTQESLAAKLGKSQSSIANKIRLLNLSDEVQEALLENKISERHARSLLRLDTEEKQNKMLNRIITERLTVRRTDEEIEKLKNSDFGSEDSKKIIEKGEMNMNDNNMFGMPSTPQNQQMMTQGFDIFGTGGQQNVQDVNINSPVQNSIKPSDVTNPTGFNIFSQTNPNNNNIDNGQGFINPQLSPLTSEQPIDNNNNQKSIPINNTMEDSRDTFKVDMPSFNTSNYEQPVISPIQSSTNLESSINNEPFNFNSSDTLGQVISNQDVNQGALSSSIPSMESFGVNQASDQLPDTKQEQIISNISPIIESPTQGGVFNNNSLNNSDSVFSFGTPSENVNNLDVKNEMQSNEFKIPDPIIVTDYNKQYDPVLPQADVLNSPKVDFKEVINAIRECSKTIEQYGYKIDVEEYDLTDIYQVIFKIEKK